MSCIIAIRKTKIRFSYQHFNFMNNEMNNVFIFRQKILKYCVIIQYIIVKLLFKKKKNYNLLLRTYFLPDKYFFIVSETQFLRYFVIYALIWSTKVFRIWTAYKVYFFFRQSSSHKTFDKLYDKCVHGDIQFTCL